MKIRSLLSALSLALALGLAVPSNAPAAFPRGSVSLDLRDADVRDVIWAFAKEHKLSVIIGEDVKGNVTLSVRNVGVQTAFDSILDNASLGYTIQGGIYRVNTLATIKANKAIEPMVTRVTTLNYFTSPSGETEKSGSASAGGEDDDLEQLRTSLEKHLSGAQGGSVTMIPRTNSLVVTDIASNVDRIVEMAKRLDIETPQVLIEAKIVEVDADYSRDLGITTNFNGARTRNTQVGGGGSSNYPSPGFAVSPGTFGALAAGPGGSAFDFFLNSIGGSDVANLNIILTAAETSGLAKTLATPRVTTLHNKEAVISSGQRIPFTSLGSIAAQGGTNLVATVQFVDAALELAVTPHVIGDGKVMMNVRASRNTADFDNTVFQNPTINTREARNQVLVPDGETIVIGGIYTQDDFKDHTGTPYLKDVPVLGHLFKSNSREKNTVELIFLITPRVIRDPAMIRASGPVGTSMPGAAALALDATSR